MSNDGIFEGCEMSLWKDFVYKNIDNFNNKGNHATLNGDVNIDEYELQANHFGVSLTGHYNPTKNCNYYQRWAILNTIGFDILPNPLDNGGTMELYSGPKDYIVMVMKMDPRKETFQ